MSVPSIDQAMATLEEGQAELTSLFAGIADEQLTRPATIGGGDWSAKDLLGHIAFWEELALEFIADWRAGRLPAITKVFADGQAGVDAANARNQLLTASQSLSEVRVRSEAAHTQLLATIRGLSEAEWNAKPYYSTPRPNEPFAELLGGILGAPKRLFAHADAHLPDLRAYVESLGTGRP